MQQTIKIQVNPQVLQWARKEAGYKQPEDIAVKLHIPTERETIGTLPVFISFPHEGKMSFFLKIDNRLVIEKE